MMAMLNRSVLSGRIKGSPSSPTMRLALFTVLPVLLATPAGAQLITAHRDASADALENTLAAFTLAWD
jgi:glycerophosphoryl diester phosphodiesterase